MAAKLNLSSLATLLSSQKVTRHPTIFISRNRDRILIGLLMFDSNTTFFVLFSSLSIILLVTNLEEEKDSQSGGTESQQTNYWPNKDKSSFRVTLLPPCSCFADSPLQLFAQRCQGFNELFSGLEIDSGSNQVSLRRYKTNSAVASTSSGS